MRCFIAIDINDQIRTALTDLQGQLNTKGEIRKGDVKWVEPKNIHLTLKFLGEIADEQAAEVSDIVRCLAAGYKKFTIDIEKVGSFGGRSARVVWVGTGKGKELLIAMQKDLEARMAAAGYPREEREYSAHLTICRVNNPKAGVKLGQLVEVYGDFRIGTIAAEAINIYQSQLTPKGPIYTLLASCKLS